MYTSKKNTKPDESQKPQGPDFKKQETGEKRVSKVYRGSIEKSQEVCKPPEEDIKSTIDRRGEASPRRQRIFPSPDKHFETKSEAPRPLHSGGSSNERNKPMPEELLRNSDSSASSESGLSEMRIESRSTISCPQPTSSKEISSNSQASNSIYPRDSKVEAHSSNEAKSQGQ